MAESDFPIKLKELYDLKGDVHSSDWKDGEEVDHPEKRTSDWEDGEEVDHPEKRTSDWEDGEEVDHPEKRTSDWEDGEEVDHPEKRTSDWEDRKEVDHSEKRTSDWEDGKKVDHPEKRTSDWEDGEEVDHPEKRTSDWEDGEEVDHPEKRRSDWEDGEEVDHSEKRTSDWEDGEKVDHPEKRTSDWEDREEVDHPEKRTSDWEDGEEVDHSVKRTSDWEDREEVDHPEKRTSDREDREKVDHPEKRRSDWEDGKKVDHPEERENLSYPKREEADHPKKCEILLAPERSRVGNVSKRVNVVQKDSLIIHEGERQSSRGGRVPSIRGESSRDGTPKRGRDWKTTRGSGPKSQTAKDRTRNVHEQDSFGKWTMWQQSGSGSKRRQNSFVQQLAEWQNEPSDVLVWNINSNNQAALKELLIGDDLSCGDNINILIKFLAKATTCQSCRQGVLNILSTVFTEGFIAKLLRYQITISVEEPVNLMVEFFTVQHQLLSNYFRAMPLNALDQITELIQTVQLILQKRIRENSEFEFLNALELYDELMKHFDKYLELKRKEIESRGREKLSNKLAALDSLSPLDDFRGIPIEPTEEDITVLAKPFVRRNIVDGKYADVHTYLDVQFRLMREDFMRPLREGVNDFINHTESKSQDVRIYNDVKVLKTDIVKGKLTYYVKLKLPKKFELETSKRLIYGNLICASDDNFATFFVAVIADRNNEQLRQGIIGVQTLSKVKINFRSQFTLVESTAFFVAYKHVLKALQHMDEATFPLSEHIVYVKPDVDPPRYLKDCPDTLYDLSVVLDAGSRGIEKAHKMAETRKSETLNHNAAAETSELPTPPTPLTRDTATEGIEILETLTSPTASTNALSAVSVAAGIENWPSCELLGLDQSQLLALHAALTSRMALIQGPPGTGKTFLGLKVVKTLLHNSHSWASSYPTISAASPELEFGQTNDTFKPPILVVCFTNHALDQFLEGMLNFTSKIVRIGGRSKSEVIQKFQVNEILLRLEQKKELPQYLHKANASMHGNFNEVENRYKRLQMQLAELAKWKGVLKWKYLVDNEIIPPAIANQLTDDTYRDWILPSDEMLKNCLKPQLRDQWEKCPFLTEQVNNDCTEINEKWTDSLQLTKEEEEEKRIIDDELLLEDKPCINSAIDQSDFEIITHDEVQQLQGFEARTGQSGSCAESERQRSNLKHKVEYLERIATFSTVGAKSLRLNGEPDVRNLGFPDRCVLYTSWKEKIIILLKKKVNEVEEELQTFISASSDSRGEKTGNTSALADLCGRSRRLHNRLAAITTLEGLLKWDVFVCSGIVPSFIMKQLSKDTYLDWILPTEPLLLKLASPAPPLLTVWQETPAENSKSFTKIDEHRWRTRLDNVRNGEDDDPQQNDQEPSSIYSSKVVSDLDEFEVCVANFEHKLKELASAKRKDSQQGNLQTLTCNIRSELKRLQEVLSFSKKDVSSLPIIANISLSKIPFEDRCVLHACWKQRLLDRKQQMCKRYELMMEHMSGIKDELKRSRYLHVTRQAEIVGMTTTGAAEYQAMIQDLGPKIVVIEEAAEILEAHVVTSLSASCEHLIMIGDHQQLRPSPAVYELATKYGLDTSLFERMIKNGIKYQTLEQQHRMRPEISRLLVPTIYPNLKDHDSVALRPDVRGFGSSVFFVTHHHKELSDSDDNKSHSNPHEAEYIMQLARHLVLQGYSTDQITVLTPYSGQFFLLKQELRKLPECTGMHVTIVDNYQGEENDIILLSLVRSNDRGIVGFLKIENRVCVALSRAKQGLYIIGNLDQLCQSTPLWVKIKESLAETNSVGDALTLRCQNHPDEISHIKKAHEFKLMCPEGGCRKYCKDSFPKCSHLCPRKCHVDDPTHTIFKCMIVCVKKCPAGIHNCQSFCYLCCRKCPPCPIIVEKPLPSCNHTKEMPCWQDPVNVKCTAPCLAMLGCGHTCKEICHMKNDPMHVTYVCTAPCSKKSRNCSENHICPRLCHEKCAECHVTVRKIARCGHTATVKCSLKMRFYNCKAACPWFLQCGHQCSKKCFENCGGCKVMVVRAHPDCGHQVKMLCNSDEKVQCQNSCNKLLKCGHQCLRKCYDKCDEVCRVVVDKTFSNCGHSVVVFCSQINETACETPCNQLLKCGHNCTRMCHADDPKHSKCEFRCTRLCHRGIHNCERLCWEDCRPCSRKVATKFPCNHEVRIECHQRNQQDLECPVVVDKKIPICEHIVKMGCTEDPSTVACRIQCVEQLDCSHYCPRACHVQDDPNHESFVCRSLDPRRVSRTLSCGHTASVDCNVDMKSYSCKLNCRRKLEGGRKCPRKCFEKCGRKARKKK